MASTEKITDGQLFAERLRELRGDRNKAEFARFLGVSAPVYQRYEDGRVPRHDYLSVIAEKCGVSVDWLLGRNPPERRIKFSVPDDLRDVPPEKLAQKMCAACEEAFRTEGSDSVKACNTLMELAAEWSDREMRSGGNKRAGMVCEAIGKKSKFTEIQNLDSSAGVPAPAVADLSARMSSLESEVRGELANLRTDLRLIKELLLKREVNHEQADCGASA